MNTMKVRGGKKKGVLLLPLVAMLAASAWVTTLTGSTARASTITPGTISMRVSDHVGVDAVGDPDGTSASNCIRYSPEDGPDSSDWVNAMSMPSEARTAHGRSGSKCPKDLDVTEQSAVGVRPATTSSIVDGEPFLLGRIIHYNNPIIGGAEYYKGVMSVRMDGFDGAPVVNFDWRMWETPNEADPCPDGDNENGCFDEIKFASQFSDSLMTQGGIDYRLLFDGFFPVASETDCPAAPSGDTNDIFWTAESETSHACLYATLGEVRKVTVVKAITGATEGITAPSSTFDFATTGSLKGSPWADGSFSLTPPDNGKDESKAVEIARGDTVTIDEGTPPSMKWALTAMSCVDFDSKGDPRPLASATYDLEKGIVTLSDVPAPDNTEKPDIICTFTNTYIPMATLTLEKTVLSGSAVASDFTLTATGAAAAPVSGLVVSGAGGSAAVTTVAVPAGAYTLSESGPIGYLSDAGWSCEGSEESTNVVLLEDGDKTTCTVSNRFSTGTLNIAVVVSDPSTGLTNTSKVFAGTYSCGTAAPIAFTATVATPFSVSGLPNGITCTATETQPTGDLLNANFSWGTPTYTTRPVTIGDATTSTITITNPIGFLAPAGSTTVVPTTTTAAPTTTTVPTTAVGITETGELQVLETLPSTGRRDTTPQVAGSLMLVLAGLALVQRRRRWSAEN